jgi:hypothetical protein
MRAHQTHRQAKASPILHTNCHTDQAWCHQSGLPTNSLPNKHPPSLTASTQAKHPPSAQLHLLVALPHNQLRPQGVHDAGAAQGTWRAKVWVPTEQWPEHQVSQRVCLDWCQVKPDVASATDHLLLLWFLVLRESGRHLHGEPAKRGGGSTSEPADCSHCKESC